MWITVTSFSIVDFEYMLEIKLEQMLTWKSKGQCYAKCFTSWEWPEVVPQESFHYATHMFVNLPWFNI